MVKRFLILYMSIILSKTLGNCTKFLDKSQIFALWSGGNFVVLNLKKKIFKDFRKRDLKRSMMDFL